MTAHVSVSVHYLCPPRNVGFLCSPYRKPLARFMNRFPTESLRYFLAPAHLSSPPIAALFQCILKDTKETPLLRVALMQDAQLPQGESVFISKVFGAQVCEGSQTVCLSVRACVFAAGHW